MDDDENLRLLEEIDGAVDEAWTRAYVDSDHAFSTMALGGQHREFKRCHIRVNTRSDHLQTRQFRPCTDTTGQNMYRHGVWKRVEKLMILNFF